MIGMIIDPKLPPDHFGDSSRRPKVRRIAKSGRPTHEKVDEFPFLPGRKLGRAAGRRNACQSFGAVLAKGLLPSEDGTDRGPDFLGHLGHRDSLSEQPDGLVATLFELLRASGRSHAS